MNENNVIENLDCVAIIGIAVRMPGAVNVEQFWENLKTGTESISLFSKDEMLESGLSPEIVNHPNFVAAKGIMDDVEMFDANFFGISPREAELMDPQHRVLMECAWAAMEDAGYIPEKFDGRIAIFTSAGMNTYLPFNLMSNPHLLEQVGGFELSIYNDKDFVPTRIAYSLNSQGPAIDIGTACSSSLVSTHLACQHLLTYQSDMTLVGGITIHLPQKMGHIHEPGAAYSPDSHCRPFDATPSGLIDGNGAAVIILKRLEDALRDGDKIHALIKGSAINNDGSDKVGYSAPSINGQAEVILEAQAAAGVDSSSIEYIEAHGTSTPLGDPIEMAGLTQAFRVSTDKTGFCGIGSVKSNIGHVDKAAGLAGLIKTTLALENELIPPSLNWQKPNPKLQIEQTPFYVVDKPKSWKRSKTPRRAGISSFGVGGTNAHAILEEAPIIHPSSESRSKNIITLSAKTKPVLEEYAKNLVNHLINYPSINLADVASTLARGRKTFPHKLVLTCSSIDEAISGLKASKSNEEKSTPKPIFMFTGQGSQYAGMAKALYQDEKIFKNAIDACANSLEPLLGKDIRTILFPDSQDIEKSNQLLQETSITQPCLFAIEYALAKLWIHWGVKPKAMIGHSLGEYVAACIAGVFTLEDALKLVVKRSQLMQEMATGAMLSVPLSAKMILDDFQRLHLALEIAAENGPNLSVVTGPKHLIEQYQLELESRDVTSQILKTSHAFHSSMMEPMLSAFNSLLSTVKFNEPTIPIISNLTGTWHSAVELKNPQYWCDHLRKTVLFSQGINRIITEIQNPLFIEIGPGRTLCQLTQLNQDDSFDSSSIIASLPQAMEHKNASDFLLESLSKAWLKNQEIDWDSFYEDERRLKVSLPTYPFERTQYWIEPGKPQTQTEDTRLQSRQTNPNHWFYANSWQSIPLLSSNNLQKSSYLIFTTSDAPVNEIGKLLTSLEHEVTYAYSAYEFLVDHNDQYHLDYNNNDHLNNLIRSLQEKRQEPHEIIFINKNKDKDFKSTLEIVNVVKAFAASPISISQIRILTCGVFDIFGENNSDSTNASILGLVKTIQYEHPSIACSLLDIEAALLPLEKSSKKVYEWLCSQNTNALLAHRGDIFWVQSIKPLETQAPNPKNILKNNENYLILGGLDGVGYAFAKTIAESVKGSLILTSIDCDYLNSTDAHSKIEELKKLGSSIHTMHIDPNSLEQGLSNISSAAGPIRGVINSYDMSMPKPMGLIQDLDLESALIYLEQQNLQLKLLNAFVNQHTPDFCILMSSLSSDIGGIGQTVSAMAGNLVNAFCRLQKLHSKTSWMVMNWDRWEEVSDAYPDASGFTPEEGSVAFKNALGLLEMGAITISTNNPQYRMESAIAKVSSANQDTIEDTNLYNRPDIDIEYHAPSTPNEIQLAKLWQDCLKINEIGIKDNFFDLGGHSLLAAQLIREIKQHFVINLDLGMFFSAPTIAELALIIEQEIRVNQTANIESQLSQIENMTEEEVESLLMGDHSPEELLKILGKS
jgi:3-oxoacyl-(acyl-carrier-protein) synthase/malonyl CoA-acyl carrier protein transacylase/acyl carrier protein